MKISDIFRDNDDIADWMDLNTTVGTGGFSKVYPINKDMVMKVTDDPAYLCFLSVLYGMVTTLVSFPVIHDHIEIEGEHYILMERLYMHQHICQMEAELAGYYSYDPCIWRCLSDNQLDEALDVLDTAYLDTFGFDWDLRDSNIMQRLDGTLVITDPWSVTY